MTFIPPPSVGAKDLKDLQGVSRSPGVALLQKQAVPPAPRAAGAGATGQPPAPSSSTMAGAAAQVFQKLKTFASNDWIKWASEYLKFRFGPRHDFLTYEGRTPSNGIYQLAGDAEDIRIGVAGDWGTGTDEAYKIAELIAQNNPHYTIHLGDVYFVGDGDEVNENFLGMQNPKCSYTPCAWPKGSKASFALNGNHEMYARGIAYFDRILPALGETINGQPQGQKASFFCLMNDNWCILGLDTGYNSVGKPLLEYVWSPDASLPDPIISWLQTIAPEIGNRSIILMTHHQVLSVFDACYTKQADQLFAIFKQPVLWFWGHEHRLALYEPFDCKSRNWPVITGRCIGHGGMPIDLPGKPQAASIGTASYVDSRPYINHEKLHVGVNGFANLTFRAEILNVDYIDIFGQTLFTEAFKAEAGSISAQGSQNFQLTRMS